MNVNSEVMVRVLLDAGADPSVQDIDQATSLFHSINKVHYGLAKMLLKSGRADVNARSSNALQEAVIHEQ